MTSAVRPDAQLRRHSSAAFAATVVIDDTSPALSALSELGRDILGEPVRKIRDAVTTAATEQAWGIVLHRDFANWAAAYMDGVDVWLSLDPLITSERGGLKMARMRITRVLAGTELVLEHNLGSELHSIVHDRTVGLLDDSTFSGSTFKHVAALVARAGGVVAEYLVCTSTSMGRGVSECAAPEAGWRQFIAGDHPALHLRDACPFLPFSGRRIRGRDVVMTPAGPVGLSYPPTAFPGSPWNVLAHDNAIAMAIRAARKVIAERLSAELQRPALVEDVLLLGEVVSLPVLPGQAVKSVTPLCELLA